MDLVLTKLRAYFIKFLRSNVSIKFLSIIIIPALEPYLQAAQVDLKKSYFMINLCGAIIVSLLYICAAERFVSSVPYCRFSKTFTKLLVSGLKFFSRPVCGGLPS